MRTIALPWETWRAIIDTLRQNGLPYMLDHADEIEARLDQTPADQALVKMTFRDDVYLRSINWALWQLGLPRPTTHA